MDNLHPHWQTTDEDAEEQPVRISVLQKHVPRARRSPAAFIGIVAFVAIGFVVFNGTGSLWGQATPTIDIRITTGVVDPLSFSARPGQKITWKNESGIPHILTSETLRDERSLPFETTAIFPNETYSFTLPLNAPVGTYEYQSQTSPNITGEIIVEDILTAASSSSAPVVQQTSSVPTAVASSSMSAAVVTSMAPPQSSSAMPISDQPETVGGIPQNPYTVGNSNGTLPPRQQGGGSNTAQVTQHRPISQPSTGMGEWMLACIGAVSLWIVMKRAMRFS